MPKNEDSAKPKQTRIPRLATKKSSSNQNDLQKRMAASSMPKKNVDSLSASQELPTKTLTKIAPERDAPKVDSIKELIPQSKSKQLKPKTARKDKATDKSIAKHREKVDSPAVDNIQPRSLSPIKRNARSISYKIDSALIDENARSPSPKRKHLTKPSPLIIDQKQSQGSQPTIDTVSNESPEFTSTIGQKNNLPESKLTSGRIKEKEKKNKVITHGLKSNEKSRSLGTSLTNPNETKIENEVSTVLTLPSKIKARRGEKREASISANDFANNSKENVTISKQREINRHEEPCSKEQKVPLPDTRKMKALKRSDGKLRLSNSTNEPDFKQATDEEVLQVSSAYEKKKKNNKITSALGISVSAIKNASSNQSASAPKLISYKTNMEDEIHREETAKKLSNPSVKPKGKAKVVKPVRPFNLKKSVMEQAKPPETSEKGIDEETFDIEKLLQVLAIKKAPVNLKLISQLFKKQQAGTSQESEDSSDLDLRNSNPASSDQATSNDEGEPSIETLILNDDSENENFNLEHRIQQPLSESNPIEIFTHEEEESTSESINEDSDMDKKESHNFFQEKEKAFEGKESEKINKSKEKEQEEDQGNKVQSDEDSDEGNEEDDISERDGSGSEDISEETNQDDENEECLTDRYKDKDDLEKNELALVEEDNIEQEDSYGNEEFGEYSEEDKQDEDVTDFYAKENEKEYEASDIMDLDDRDKNCKQIKKTNQDLKEEDNIEIEDSNDGEELGEDSEGFGQNYDETASFTNETEAGFEDENDLTDDDNTKYEYSDDIEESGEDSKGDDKDHYKTDSSTDENEIKFEKSDDLVLDKSGIHMEDIKMNNQVLIDEADIEAEESDAAEESGDDGNVEDWHDHKKDSSAKGNEKSTEDIVYIDQDDWDNDKKGEKMDLINEDNFIGEDDGDDDKNCDEETEEAGKSESIIYSEVEEKEKDLGEKDKILLNDEDSIGAVKDDADDNDLDHIRDEMASVKSLDGINESLLEDNDQEQVMISSVSDKYVKSAKYKFMWQEYICEGTQIEEQSKNIHIDSVSSASQCELMDSAGRKSENLRNKTDDSKISLTVEEATILKNTESENTKFHLQKCNETKTENEREEIESEIICHDLRIINKPAKDKNVGFDQESESKVQAQSSSTAQFDDKMIAEVDSIRYEEENSSIEISEKTGEVEIELPIAKSAEHIQGFFTKSVDEVKPSLKNNAQTLSELIFDVEKYNEPKKAEERHYKIDKTLINNALETNEDNDSKQVDGGKRKYPALEQIIYNIEALACEKVEIVKSIEEEEKVLGSIKPESQTEMESASILLEEPCMMKNEIGEGECSFSIKELQSHERLCNEISLPHHPLESSPEEVRGHESQNTFNNTENISTAKMGDKKFPLYIEEEKSVKVMPPVFAEDNNLGSEIGPELTIGLPAQETPSERESNKVESPKVDRNKPQDLSAQKALHQNEAIFCHGNKHLTNNGNESEFLKEKTLENASLDQHTYPAEDKPLLNESISSGYEQPKDSSKVHGIGNMGNSEGTNISPEAQGIENENYESYSSKPDLSISKQQEELKVALESIIEMKETMAKLMEMLRAPKENIPANNDDDEELCQTRLVEEVELDLRVEGLQLEASNEISSGVSEDPLLPVYEQRKLFELDLMKSMLEESNINRASFSKVSEEESVPSKSAMIQDLSFVDTSLIHVDLIEEHKQNAKELLIEPSHGNVKAAETEKHEGNGFFDNSEKLNMTLDGDCSGAGEDESKLEVCFFKNESELMAPQNDGLLIGKIICDQMEQLNETVHKTKPKSEETQLEASNTGCKTSESSVQCETNGQGITPHCFQLHEQVLPNNNANTTSSKTDQDDELPSITCSLCKSNQQGSNKRNRSIEDLIMLFNLMNERDAPHNCHLRNQRKKAMSSLQLTNFELNLDSKIDQSAQTDFETTTGDCLPTNIPSQVDTLTTTEDMSTKIDDSEECKSELLETVSPEFGENDDNLRPISNASQPEDREPDASSNLAMEDFCLVRSHSESSLKKTLKFSVSMKELEASDILTISFDGDCLNISSSSKLLAKSSIDIRQTDTGTILNLRSVSIDNLPKISDGHGQLSSNSTDDHQSETTSSIAANEEVARAFEEKMQSEDNSSAETVVEVEHSEDANNIIEECPNDKKVLYCEEVSFRSDTEETHKDTELEPISFEVGNIEEEPTSTEESDQEINEPICESITGVILSSGSHENILEENAYISQSSSNDSEIQHSIIDDELQKELEVIGAAKLYQERSRVLPNDDEFDDQEFFSIYQRRMARRAHGIRHRRFEPILSPQSSLPTRTKVCKILFIGSSSTGKTSIIRRYVKKTFAPSYRATIGADFLAKVVKWNENITLRLQLWDIAGQDRFSLLSRSFYKDAVGAFVVSDISRPETLDAVVAWKEELDTKVQRPDGTTLPCFLLANKCDLIEDSSHQSKQHAKVCQQHGFQGWIQTSAKEDININDAMTLLLKMIVEHEMDPSSSSNRDKENQLECDSITLEVNDRKKKASGCKC